MRGRWASPWPPITLLSPSQALGRPSSPLTPFARAAGLLQLLSSTSDSRTLDSLTLVPEGRGTAPAGGMVGRLPDLALWVGPPLSTKRKDKGKLPWFAALYTIGRWQWLDLENMSEFWPRLRRTQRNLLASLSWQVKVRRQRLGMWMPLCLINGY